MSDKKKKDYELGYGKPPRHSQFQKGQSGNPRGGRRAPASLEQIAASVLSEKLAVSTNGKKRKVSTVEAILMAQRQKALHGDHRATTLLLELQKRQPAPEPSPQTPPGMMSPEELIAEFNLEELELYGELARKFAARQKKGGQ